MDAARHDRLVWTDDDFQHPSSGLHASIWGYLINGPTTEFRVVARKRLLALLLERLC